MIQGLSLVELVVRDWTASVAWYHDVLGLEVRHRDEANGYVLLDTRSGAQLSLKQGEPRPGGVLLLFEVDDCAAWAERLERAGVACTFKRSAEGYGRLRFVDPDGYGIVLYRLEH
ncbi:MAG: VOC family protein [Gemmataceae bacterium]